MPNDGHKHSLKTEVLCEKREGKAYLSLLIYVAAYTDWEWKAEPEGKEESHVEQKEIVNLRIETFGQS